MFEFILDCYEENVPFFTITRKITKYLEHYEASGWDVTGTDYPSFLLVCGSPALEKRLQKHICRTLDRLCQMEPVFYTTTYKALMSTTNSEDPIWSNVFEPVELTFLI